MASSECQRSAVSDKSFEQAYRAIGRLLRIFGIADAKTDVKQLVKARLSDDGSVLFDPLQEGGPQIG